MTLDWCLGITVLSPFQPGVRTVLFGRAVHRAVVFAHPNLEQHVCSVCMLDFGVLGKLCLLTRCDTDADSGVRVFVGPLLDLWQR